jgi:hypothetical protein
MTKHLTKEEIRKKMTVEKFISTSDGVTTFEEIPLSEHFIDFLYELQPEEVEARAYINPEHTQHTPNPETGHCFDCSHPNIPTASEVKEEKWKPKEDGRYYYIYSDGDVVEASWTDFQIHINRLAFGNCFSSAEKAIEARDKVKQLLQSL